MSKFSTRLRLLRDSRGLTQQQLADMLSISKSSVNMYERGEREPGFETMESIADLFNVDMNYLLGLSDIRNSITIVSSIPAGFQPIPEMEKVPIVGRIACG